MNKTKTFALWIPFVGLVEDSTCKTKADAAFLLSERVALGVALNGERVVFVNKSGEIRQY